MREPKFEQDVPAPWHFPVAVEDIAESGEHFDLIADADARKGVARMAGLRDLPRLEANFDVTRAGPGGLRVAGRVSATVGQTCVVTLEPLANEVEEAVDLLFVPQAAADGKSVESDVQIEKSDHAEPLIGGTVDLGAIATEFLILGLDPYPRKPGAVFRPPMQEMSDDGPFAALATLKKAGDGD